MAQIHELDSSDLIISTIKELRSDVSHLRNELVSHGNEARNSAAEIKVALKTQDLVLADHARQFTDLRTDVAGVKEDVKSLKETVGTGKARRDAFLWLAGGLGTTALAVYGWFSESDWLAFFKHVLRFFVGS